MTPAVLYPGDSIHLMLPSTGDESEDNRLIDELRAAYARYGVNLHIGSASTAPGSLGVIAIFRKPMIVPVEDK